jgi:hypothetical protein
VDELSLLPFIIDALVVNQCCQDNVAAAAPPYISDLAHGVSSP